MLYMILLEKTLSTEVFDACKKEAYASCSAQVQAK